MDITDQLSALAHPDRMAVFRLLMRRYPQSVPAGEIATALDLRQNTASGHLKTLQSAALIAGTRQGTTIRYGIAMDGARALMDGLFAGCCQSRPDLCLPLTPSAQIGVPKMSNTPYTVLFICTGNSARSIMAEAIMNHEGGGRFRAYSAGTQPTGAPNPKVIELLHSKGMDTSNLRSKITDEFAGEGAPALDFVFTVCDHAANEECPVWPGQPMSAHWGLPDPARATGSDAEKELAFQQAYGLLRNRITAFAALPMDTLDRISLQHALDGIGRSN
ncbi:MAG: metalloregulator ArsR/SmtB family transcription factor [Pseudomonadota bacterium]